jgi:DNA-binding ferritin-like protein
MRYTNKKRNILTGRRPTRKRLTKGGKRASAGPGAGLSAMPNAIVPTFLHMLNTVKLYHWKTTSFSTHKATDELYGSLNDKIDEFVEVMLGKGEMGGRTKLLNVSLIKLSVYSNNEAFKKQIESYKDFLLAFNDSLGLTVNTDLLAIRDEILASFNKFLYLLTLGA